MDIAFDVNTTTATVTPRRIGVEATILALTAFVVQARALRGELGVGLGEVLEGLALEGSALLARLRPETVEGGGEPIAPPVDTPPAAEEAPIPEELRALADEATLRSRRLVNDLLDARAIALSDILKGEAVEGGEAGAAAQLLQRAWFETGRGFINAPWSTQWLAFDTRWGHIAPGSEVDTAIQLLRLGAKVETLKALNAWFGKLQGITAPREAPPAPPPRDEPMPEALALLARVLCFAHVAWPGDSAESTQRRLLLAGPYLKEVEAAWRRASESARAGAAKRGAAPGDA